MSGTSYLPRIACVELTLNSTHLSRLFNSGLSPLTVLGHCSKNLQIRRSRRQCRQTFQQIAKVSLADNSGRSIRIDGRPKWVETCPTTFNLSHPKKTLNYKTIIS